VTAPRRRELARKPAGAIAVDLALDGTERSPRSRSIARPAPIADTRNKRCSIADAHLGRTAIYTQDGESAGRRHERLADRPVAKLSAELLTQLGQQRRVRYASG